MTESLKDESKWFFVSNLAWKTKEEDLIELFSQHCEVVEARVERKERAKTSQSRGFGYVRLKHSDACQKAALALKGTLLQDRPLMVEVARKNPKKKKEKSKPSFPNHEKRFFTSTTSNNLMEGPRKRRKLDLSGIIDRARKGLIGFQSSLEKEPHFRKLRKFWKDIVVLCQHEGDAEVKSFAKEAIPILSSCLLPLAQSAKASNSLEHSKESPFNLVKRSIERLNEIEHSSAYEHFVKTLVEFGIEWERELASVTQDENISVDLLSRYENRNANARESERKMVMEKVEQCVKMAFPNSHCELKVFGSTATPLCDVDSDLDIGLEIAGVSREVMRNSDFAKESLKPLQKALFDAGLKNKFITHTRIPLLRLKNAPIPTEICLYDSYNGKKAFYLTSICKEDPRTGPFLYAVKFWALLRGLSNPRHPFGQGGLCSFGYIMVACCVLIQSGVVSSMECKKLTPMASLTTRDLLILFFRLLSQLDAKESFIRTRTGTIEPREDSKESLVIIQDPVDAEDNCARNICAPMWKRIQRESLRAKILLEQNIAWKHILGEAEFPNSRSIRLMFFS